MRRSWLKNTILQQSVTPWKSEFYYFYQYLLLAGIFLDMCVWKKKSLDYLITCSKRAEGTGAVVSKPPPPPKKKNWFN